MNHVALASVALVSVVVFAACGGSTEETPPKAAAGMSGAGGSGGASVAGKGGSSGTGNKAGTGGAAGKAGSGPFETATHGLPPKMPAGSGKVLSVPQIVTVTFASDTKASSIETFGDFIVGSDWLETTGKEYGVAKGVHVGKVQLAEAAPKAITDEQIQTWLDGKLKDGTLPAPPDVLDNDYLYLVYFPQGTSITLQGEKGCQSFLGYHNSIYTDDRHIAYAVMPRCGQNNLFNTVSHEIHEAATDPYPLDQPSYRFSDQNVPWTFFGGETADVCGELHTQEGGYTLSRVYSNAAAKADEDWCIPAPPDDVMYGVYPSPAKTVFGKPGETVKITLTGWSKSEIEPFFLDVYPYQSTFNADPALSSGEINNGGEVTLELTIPSSAKSGQDYASVLVVSARTQEDFHMWPVAVIVK